MTSFSDQIKVFSSKSKKRIEYTVIETRKAVSENVINLTPVDTGYARGNWQASTGAPESGTIDRFDTEAGFAPTTGTGKSIRAMEKVATQDLDESFYLVNSAPYIRNLEYWQGSDQAPFGMVRATVADFDYILSRVFRGMELIK